MNYLKLKMLIKFQQKKNKQIKKLKKGNIKPYNLLTMAMISIIKLNKMKDLKEIKK